MMQPFFSICIAAFNAGIYFDDCLWSIATQDCRDYEVVIIDDGSVEPLILDKGIAESLPAVRIERVSNGGPYAARQKAFDLARGEVLVCVDSDDKLFDRSMLSKLKQAFISHGADVVIYNATCDEQRAAKFLDLSGLGEGGIVDEGAVWRTYTKGYSLNSLWCKAFKRTLYTKGGKPRPRLLMAEDRLQSLEIMRNAHSYRLIDEPLYFYRPNPTSTTNAGYDPAFFSQACYVEEEVFEFMEGRGMPVDKWARYFLGYTSSALLGIRYNRGLDAAARRRAYAAVGTERAVGLALESCPVDSLPKVDRLRLGLLLAGRYAALDVSMLPWKVGSFLKHLPDGIWS